MNERHTAQRICQMIDGASSGMSDSKRYNTPVGLDIWLNGTSYEAEVVQDGELHAVEVGLESLAFPCIKFSVSNGIALFECIDPAEISTQPVSIGQIEDTLREAGIKTINKAVIKIHIENKVEVATAVGCEDHVIHWSQFGKNGMPMIAAGYIDLDKVLELDYSPAIQKIAQDDFSAEMQFSESMKKLGARFFNEEESKFHEYRFSFIVNGKTNAQHIDVTASTIEDAVTSFNEKVADELPKAKVTKITNITRDGKIVSKAMLDMANKSLLDECDGGAAAGGDGGGAVQGGGDASGADAGTADIGDTAAEMSGITTTDVLGKCVPGGGYMGKDNFYIPARAKVPMHRWEAANGGSKRKKEKQEV